MNYQEALAYIATTANYGSVPGLERIRDLLHRMGDPQKKLKFVHVAGTNGKGSATTMTANILRHAGYKTGLDVSPFVIDFRERMQINGEMISREELVECTEYVRPFADQIIAEGNVITEFELVTAVAMEWYMRRKCDVVCLEVGLGGRLDATNVIDPPLVQVIMSISLDHMEQLGDTVGKIAREKCGIVKGGQTVVYPIQKPEAMAAIMEECARKGSSVILPNAKSVARLPHKERDGLPEILDGLDFEYGGLRLHTSLPGEHQIYNAITVVEAARVLREKGFALSDEDIAYGIGHTSFPARMEVLSRRPLVVLDGAHNRGGAETMEAMLRELESRPITLVMGMLADKDYEGALECIARHATRFLALRPDSPRALSAGELARAASRFCPDVKPFEDVRAALTEALESLPENGALIMCGSLYLAGQVRPLMLELLRG